MIQVYPSKHYPTVHRMTQSSPDVVPIYRCWGWGLEGGGRDLSPDQGHGAQHEPYVNGDGFPGSSPTVSMQFNLAAGNLHGEL